MSYNQDQRGKVRARPADAGTADSTNGRERKEGTRREERRLPSPDTTLGTLTQKSRNRVRLKSRHLKVTRGCEQQKHVAGRHLIGRFASLDNVCSSPILLWLMVQ